METAKEIIKFHSKLFIDANIWDGEDRAGCNGDSAKFTPDELQELFYEFIDSVFAMQKQGIDRTIKK